MAEVQIYLPLLNCRLDMRQSDLQGCRDRFPRSHDQAILDYRYITWTILHAYGNTSDKRASIVAANVCKFLREDIEWFMNAPDTEDWSKARFQTKSTGTFTIFGELPKELRLAIWKLDIPDRRIVEVDAHFLQATEHTDRDLRFTLKSQNVNLLSVCHESRGVALELLPYRLPSMNPKEEIRFGPGDSLNIHDFETFLRTLNGVHNEDIQLYPALSKVKALAFLRRPTYLPYLGNANLRHCMEIYHWLLHIGMVGISTEFTQCFSDVKEVQLVEFPGLYGTQETLEGFEAVDVLAPLGSMYEYHGLYRDAAKCRKECELIKADIGWLPEVKFPTPKVWVHRSALPLPWYMMKLELSEEEEAVLKARKEEDAKTIYWD